MKSNTILNIAIAVTGAAIIAILANLISSLFFKTSLNSPVYYGIVIVLALASVMFAVLQILPKFLASPRTNVLEAEGTDTEHELQGFTQQRIEYQTKNKQQNYPVKVTMEINGTPVTIESPDVGKVEDIMKLLTQVVQASSSIGTEAKASQSLIRESEGTYQVDDTSR
jgi:hypothetical protein